MAANGDFAPTPGRYPLVVGELSIKLETDPFIGSRRLTRFLPSVDYEVGGMINRHRQAGLGVALIGLFDDQAARAEGDRLADRAAVPLTALLQIDGGIGILGQHSLPAEMGLFWPGDIPSVWVGEHEVPLEVELTTPVAYHFNEDHGFDSEIVDFFSRTRPGWRIGSNYYCRIAKEKFRSSSCMARPQARGAGPT